MKVAVLQFFSWPQRRVPLPTVYDRALQRIHVMDETGYDAVWLAEHHFSSFSICPSVHMMGLHIAASTKNLRIGTAVSLASMYHPLRLAEEVALLDVLSGGRVNWGAGRGFAEVEFNAFGIPPGESYPRFREHVQCVLAAWTQDRVTFRGEYVHYEDLEVLPKPLQQPHPPVWLAASSTDAIDWAAREGFTIMLDPHSSHGIIGEKYVAWQQGMEAAGHGHAGREVPMARLIAVAATDAEAEAVARAGAQWTVGAYANPTNSKLPQNDRFTPGAVASTTDPVQRYVDDVIVHGSPAKVLDTLERLRDEMHLHYLMCAPLSHESFVLFTEHVLPKLL